MLITLFTIVVVIFSAILHEYAHGWVAYKLGDSTARDAGRLTLNPLAHLDPVGSVLVPAILILSNSSFFIAWAKPVPYNPYNLRDQKYGDLKVALGGPGTNFIIAIFFGILARFLPVMGTLKETLAVAFFSGDNGAVLSGITGSLPASIFVLSIIICFVNLLLGLFNLIPVPPLDGSKVLLTFLPYNLRLSYYKLEPYGFIIVLLLVWLGLLNFILSGLLFRLFSLITGL